MSDDNNTLTIEKVAEAIVELSEKDYNEQNYCASYVSEASRKLAITALQAYQGWISVEDRLPTEDDADDYGRMLFYWDNGLVDVWNHVVMGENVKVTHWKPLPEPPKGE